MWATSSHALLAIRLPTVLATLITTIVIYGYSRSFLSRTGALAAGAAYATMIQVMQLGMLAETEATMTLCVGASLLVWHWGYLRRWPAWRTWMAGYLLAALAALAKGPQGPIYFGGAVVVYLAIRRDWRFLLRWSHLAGVACFALVVGAWQVPYSLSVSWPDVLRTWGHTSTQRFDYSDVGLVVEHLAMYPVEIIACLLPWSLWLGGLVKSDVRKKLGEAREPVIFLITAIAVAFPTCWLAPQARGRYFMPLYPCFAPLIGLVIERAIGAARTTALARMWRWVNLASAPAFAAAGLAVLIATYRTSPSGTALTRSPLAQPPAFAFAFAALTWLAAAIVWRARNGDARRAQAALVATAAFIGLSFTGVYINSMVRLSEQTAENVARLKRQLPPGTRLVSLGRAHHPFVYHYGETIPWLDWPKAGQAQGDYEYFCFHSVDGRRKPLPFAWEEIAAISCDRNVRARPYDVMVVGRKLNSPQAKRPRPSQPSRR
jgi:4-amino-4-deoxy-L-arabinose transferase-like glycosyltransferase